MHLVVQSQNHAAHEQRLLMRRDSILAQVCMTSAFRNALPDISTTTSHHIAIHRQK